MPAKKPKGLTCPKCAAAMEEGLILDHGAYNIGFRPQWVRGGVEFSLKTGLKTSSGARGVATWRCTKCGFLESYAG
jgi:hypothetical protein